MNYETMLNHQDWKTIVVNKPKKQIQKAETKIIGNKKIIQTNITNKSIEKKADNDELQHKRLDHSMRMSIIQKRNELKLSQKDLAKQINLPLQIIQDIESGKAIYNHNHIQKIKKKIHF